MEENKDENKKLEVSQGPCDKCGDKNGNYCINPYDEEIYGEEKWEYICPTCYSMLLEEL